MTSGGSLGADDVDVADGRRVALANATSSAGISASLAAQDPSLTASASCALAYPNFLDHILFNFL